jgi:alkylation response protein AidB-like acyl-CoA dehydrogenase
MNFNLSEDQAMIADMVSKFAREEIAPKAEHVDRTCEFPLENLEKMAGLNLLGVMVPQEYGGAELDTVSYSVIIEEIARACASTAVIASVHNSMVEYPLMTFGSTEQKSRYLQRLASGEIIGAAALTEPGAGSDPSSMETTAVRDGDFYVLNGTKAFITNAVAAHLFIVYATVGKDLGKEGISAFLMERNTPGLTVGKHEEMLGVRGSGTCQLIFESCRVPAANLLGKEGDGLKIALSSLDVGRIGIAAQAVGIGQACMDEAVAYSKERRQFGQPISSFEMVQNMLVEMATEIDAARLLVRRAAFCKDQRMRFSKEASMAKLFASDTAMKTAINAVQVHGGYGYSKEYPVERHFRDAKVTQIYEGTSEVQKIVIARNILS